MQLARKSAQPPLISLVPLVDVMLILLVFFMVTSTYLNLDMIPMVEKSDDTATASGPSDGSTVLIRIGADGQTYLRGQPVAPALLSGQIKDRLQENPLLSVILLPSSQASTQSLVSTMDLLTTAGATRLRLMRLEAAK